MNQAEAKTRLRSEIGELTKRVDDLPSNAAVPNGAGIPSDELQAILRGILIALAIVVELDDLP